MKEWQNVDREIFENEIFPANQPAVMRGLLRNWPAVEAGRESSTSVVSYLKRLDTGGTVNAFVGRPEIAGRFFYTDDYRGFNFNSQNVSISTALDTLLSLAEAPEQPAIALQAIEVAEVMPAFAAENALQLLDGDVSPRIWISSRSMIAAHFDINHNIACVVSGRRKFTVFPPDQVSNLYVGPLLNTPGGPPISVVDLRNPDVEKFPRFARALEAAQEAVLEPGDAVFIPVLWWHGVESLESLNLLVNYWWNDADPVRSDPMLSLIHAMVLLSGLPASQREGWRELFDCLVFGKYGAPGAHLPADLRDVMGNLSPAEKQRVIESLAERLKR
ncbi:MAG: cupin-like domain-containing protein [Woeseiaceae bacterium]|nr:cupin-like domain-containing protein [Woeseiaceae bacterium]